MPRGRTPEVFLIQLAEIVGITVAYTFSDRFDGEPSFLQQVSCFIQTCLYQVVDGGFPGFLLENLGDVHRTQIHVFRYLIQGDILHVVFINKGNDGIDQVIPFIVLQAVQPDAACLFDVIGFPEENDNHFHNQSFYDQVAARFIFFLLGYNVIVALGKVLLVLYHADDGAGALWDETVPGHVFYPEVPDTYMELRDFFLFGQYPAMIGTGIADDNIPFFDGIQLIIDIIGTGAGNDIDQRGKIMTMIGYNTLTVEPLF